VLYAVSRRPTVGAPLASRGCQPEICSAGDLQRCSSGNTWTV
jgi:hypothetical protein